MSIWKSTKYFCY